MFGHVLRFPEKLHNIILEGIEGMIKGKKTAGPSWNSYIGQMKCDASHEKSKPLRNLKKKQMDITKS
jgi:hypothetical protein